MSSYLQWGYFHAWMIAFTVTQLVEVPLYRWLAPTGWWRAFSLSLATHPAVWYVIPPLCYGAGLQYRGMLYCAEAFAWLTEALLLRLYGVRWRRALIVAALVNGASVLVGMGLRAVDWMP